ncbi:MAG: phytase [Calditrichaceae bacterium]|nr:phytase [Calditrichia bacterium]NUQ42269.1 phytase [Calditrichaceae bacterium]
MPRFIGRSVRTAFVWFFFGAGMFLSAQTNLPYALELDDPAAGDQDDMCIWIHPQPAQSTIIASDKGSDKVIVYDLQGNTLQIIPLPSASRNIDVRYNFPLSGQPVDIVGFGMDVNQILFYTVDPATRELNPAGSFSSQLDDVYGFALYHSPFDGKYYAMVSNNSGSGQIEQWELVDNGNGAIAGIHKRTWTNGAGGLTEGLVADDETGKFYAASEDHAIYKYDADPLDPTPSPTLVASVGQNGLSADIEGITIYYAANGEGYLIASSQGSDDFIIYQRKPPHNYVMTFTVQSANGTDGIDVTNVNLGGVFSGGLFLAHDGSRILGAKFADTGLPPDTAYWNPRSGGISGASTVTFAAIGDYGEDNEPEQAVADLIDMLEVDFIITTGDNSYGNDFDQRVGQYYSNYIGNYQGNYGSGSPVNRFFPSLGNHDNLTNYLAFFTLPGENIPTSNTSANERYYDFIRGPVHFFAINSCTDEPDGISSASAQAQWLQAQLAASNAPWKIVHLHHPPYSSGKDEEIMCWPFEDWGASAVLAGHHHSYQRIHRDDNGDGAILPYFVTGLGGADINNFSTPTAPGTMFQYNADYGTMLIFASEDSITFQFYSITNGGSLIDSFTMAKFSVLVKAKVFLEGPFVSNSMSTYLSNAGLLPLGQPFNAAPWNYSGTESVSSVPDGVVDWVLIKLRSAASAASEVAARAAFLKNDGTLMDIDGGSGARFPGLTPGNYYLVICHRNHLAIMSNSAQALDASGALYDFTTAQEQAYGFNPMKELAGGIFGMIAGDGNADGEINDVDKDAIWRFQNGTAYHYSKFADFNFDGGIDVLDMNLKWRPNLNRSTQVP